MMNWKGFGRKRPWPNRSVILVCLETLRKTTNILSDDNRYPDIDSNRKRYDLMLSCVNQ
jgi:hypothetical protein